MAGDLSHWTTGNYQVRVEDISRIQDMINQLILSLRLPFLCLTDFDHGAIGLARMIERKFPHIAWPALSPSLEVSEFDYRT